MKNLLLFHRSSRAEGIVPDVIKELCTRGNEFYLSVNLNELGPRAEAVRPGT